MNIIKQGEDLWVVCKFFKKSDTGESIPITDLTGYEFYLSISFRQIEKIRVQAIKNPGGIFAFKVDSQTTASLSSGNYDYEIAAIDNSGYILTKYPSQLYIENSPLGLSLSSIQSNNLISDVNIPEIILSNTDIIVEQYMIQITMSGVSNLCQDKWDDTDSILSFLGTVLRGGQGVPGPSGLSAYELAIQSGYFNGTLEQWLDSLKGDPGDPSSNDYSKATNKPKINGIELSGDKSSSDLSLASKQDIQTLKESKLDTNKQKTKLSELLNDLSFVSKDTNELLNYYQKTDTYTRLEIDSILSGGTAGIATETLIPVQPEDATVTYLAVVNSGQTKTFQHFIGSDGNPITVSANQTQSKIIILIWNKIYWTYTECVLNTPGVTFEDTRLTTTNLGGIPKGTDLSGKSIIEILEMALYQPGGDFY